MIARSWDGLTPAGQADAYTEYIRRTGFKDLLATNGNRGVFLLRRREGEKTRFRVMSLWDSMDGIRRFAGDEPERARYYPDDARFLTALDPNVAALRGGGRGRHARRRRGGRGARARARDARPRRRLARTGARRAARRRVGRDGLGPSDRLGPHDLGSGAPRDGVDRRVPPPSRRRGRGGAGSGGLPGAAFAHAQGLGPGDAGALRGASRAHRTRGAPHRRRARPAHSEPRLRRALPGAGRDSPHRVPQRADRAAAEDRGTAAKAARGGRKARTVQLAATWPER